MKRIHPLGHCILAAAALMLTSCDAPSTGPRQSEDAKRDSLAPTRSGFAEVAGARIAYDVHGDLRDGKTPLVVLHGSLMSGAAMSPLVQPFLSSRPVITVDARGHGRTGDVEGPLTYEQMADDVAGVLRSLGVRKADVLGYSMGGSTALIMAVRHPDLVGKQVIVSAPASRDGWFPQVQAGFEQWKPELFAGTSTEAAFKKLTTTPHAFASVVNKLRELEKSDYDLSPADVRAIKDKTMIILGDNDGVDPAHALELFGWRGGVDAKAATQGYISSAPRVRLAILPATSHVGIMNQGRLIGDIVKPFLDDQAPARPSGFFEGMDAPAGQASQGS